MNYRHLRAPMPVPWLQIVQLVPSIVEVSRELLKRTKRLPAQELQASVPQTADELAMRVMALEENEQRQAELVSKMAEQMSNLTRAITALHRQVMWLSGISAVAVVAAIIAIGISASQ
jgi:hypothetical protein